MAWSDDVIAVQVTPEQMWEADRIAHAASAALRVQGQEPDFLSNALALVPHVPEKWSRIELSAITFRMQALEALLEGREIDKWAIADKSDPGAWFVPEAVMVAAAKARIILQDTPTFELGEFKMLALQASQPEGRA